MPWPAVFCHFPFHSPVHPWLGLTSHTICHSSGGLFGGKAGQLGQLLWPGVCPLGAQIRSGSFFRCVQSRDFNLVKGCGIYFPKCCPNSVLFFFSCLLGLRWLLNALNYAGSLCIFKHLCVIQITGGHRAWLTGQLRLRNGEIPRNLTMDRVLGGWVAA